MRRECGPGELADYYDYISARADRDELVMALAYGVLVSLLTHPKRTSNDPAPDVTRLQWGPQVEAIPRNLGPTGSIIDMSAVVPRTGVETLIGAGSTMIVTADPRR